MLRQVAISSLLALLALPAAARTRPHYGGTLRIEIEGDPWQQPNGLARRLTLDSLTRMDANGTLHPSLAVQWRSENDNHRWEFRLRPGVHFSDGSPVTSVSVVTALNLACFADCPWTAIHSAGASVVFTGESPMPNLPALLAGDEFLIAADAGGNIGTGPFQITGFTNGVLTLTANENCWQGRPFVDAIQIQVHRAIRDQWLDLSVGRADLVEVPPEQLRQAREQRLTLLESPPVTLLALTVSNSGALGNPDLRAAIALAVDRNALSNVIFQKQGEVTASLFPSALTGYAFLFPTERDLNKSHEKHGGLTPPPLTMTAEGGGAMQLAAQRIALNLHEAGFNVQLIAAGGTHPADLALRSLPLPSNQPRAALEAFLRGAGIQVPVLADNPASLYQVERDFLENHTLIPLLYLPRAYAVSGRVRDLRLDADGAPLVAGASLQDRIEDAP
ncbi:MAG: ABC transporter substrate-binding protein [Terracidiphilus sp.]